MSIENDNMAELHQLLQLLQTVDVGLVLLDRNYNIRLWNSFMENHSGIHTNDARDQNLFSVFPNLPEAWLKKKIDSVFSLHIRSYSTWEQRPRVFEFRSMRPLTGTSELMYQNITIIPLADSTRQVTQVCMLVYDVTEVAASRKQLELANESLRQLSRTDTLTGLYNRGYWEECLEQEFLRCKRTRQVSSLIMLDIDNFKQFNDELGHQAGDTVLREVSEIIKRTARETDTAGRYGGEEFAVILPDTRASRALVLAERLRENVAAARVEWNNAMLGVTISLGICELNTAMKTHTQWIESADLALYDAKESGRNCSVIHGTVRTSKSNQTSD